ncbi:MAG: DUF4111 domain-containing protein [Anaerolineae bacterium]|nr:DUF4111 domain-containing protein [Anaerolineae bacterium]
MPGAGGAAVQRLTPYPDVNALLSVLLDGVRDILGDRLIGMYLYGSLSLGDFDPDSSDVDFLFVTEAVLPTETLDALRDLHTRIAASGMRFANKLEGSYIPRAALRRHDPANVMHPTIGIDWDFGVRAHGSNWIVERWIVRERGVTVWGPPPATLIDPVAPDELKAAVCESLKFWQDTLADPAWLEPRDYQAFAVLTMCRALYTLNRGEVATKPDAARWALENLDPAWHPQIERALVWRHQHARDDLTATLDFIRFALARGS